MGSSSLCPFSKVIKSNSFLLAPLFFSVILAFGVENSTTNNDTTTTPQDSSYYHYSVFNNESSEDVIPSQVVTLQDAYEDSQEEVSNTQGMVYGLRVEKSPKAVGLDDNAVPIILAHSPAHIRFFGVGFTNETLIKFVTRGQARGSNCDDLPSTKSFKIEQRSLDSNSLINFSVAAVIDLPPLGKDEIEFYLCLKDKSSHNSPWVHQGMDKGVVLKTCRKWLPFWAHILLFSVLLLLSGLFSGLNLGLMAMDRTELKILENAGSEKEKRYAKKIKPLRNSGNYLLCSLILGNVMVNSTLTILLDDLTTGIVAAIGSTIGIVVFGEIIPQSVFSRYGLAVGAHTVWVTKVTMFLTFPLSYPISMILDRILGEEIGNIYNRERLRELIKVTEPYSDLKQDEMNVIEGVLRLGQRTCGEVMTKLENVFMLPFDSILDFETIDDIIKSGFSRIPIYDGGCRTNIISILYTKDLAFVDPDDKIPLRFLCEFYRYPCNFVGDTKPLDTMFKEFKDGNKGHMAFVQCKTFPDLKKEGCYTVVGVITIEDVIEELIQAEIQDETDVRISMAKSWSYSSSSGIESDENSLKKYYEDQE